ncbi:MAG: divalent-cation tolerance protein CutA [Candidatus Marinimicrobia bacterium]|nr:divalent-cation tolerance protein CutA [Candidatus Neomarinimicrobiota bacterium]MBL7010094.1 divalent-cation tolerance protein CutA [Candidatus Neomarinimicrobiota bacterium]MBL7029995.1 divalent-cation tolerance protein CutA [Candidatus Neomarinimicrobiota bacterium]
MEANIIFTTVPDKSTGEKIANHLVEHKLAACVNILPKMTSIYKWKGEVHNEAERLVIIKSLKKFNEASFKAIKNIHPYDVPEIISMDIIDGDIDYLNWISGSLE